MLDICDVFSKEYFVKYNASKTVGICYGKSGGKPKRSLRLDGECIRRVTSVKYLGNIHCSSMTNCDDIKYKKRIYISSVNQLNCQFLFASNSTRAKLLQTYCSAWYGSQNWQLDTEAVRGFHTEWNKAIRRTLGLPPCTRSKLLPHLAGNQSFTRQVECRWLKFYHCMLTSENEKISYIGKRSLDNVIGCIGKNRIYIPNKFDRNTLHCKLPIDCIQNNDRERIQMIKELIDVKEGNSYVPFIHNNDLETTVDYLCTYEVKHFAPTPVEFCGINFYCMSWQTWNKSWLIGAILCHSPASDMLEFDFHVLILHLMSSYSCVNNPMHIEIYVIFYLRFLFLYWNSAMNCTCICICVLYCLCWICVLYCICWICVLYWNVYFYFVINHYHFFVILQLELHVCIMLTFMFCEINYIYIKRTRWHNSRTESSIEYFLPFHGNIYFPQMIRPCHMNPTLLAFAIIPLPPMYCIAISQPRSRFEII